MKALDLFCGLGGWSKGLKSQNFDVMGVDIVDVGYPYEIILADVTDINGHDFASYDLIVGSPPCRDFSRITAVGKHRWQEPPDPQRGLLLVTAFLRVVKEAKPTIWLMENSYRLAPLLEATIGLKPRMVVNLARGMKRAFWGDFPLFLISFDTTRPYCNDIHGPHRAWTRAEIPFPVANSFASAAKQIIMKGDEHGRRNSPS